MVYKAHYIMYNVHYIMYNAHYIMYNAHYIMYNAHYMNIHYIIYIVNTRKCITVSLFVDRYNGIMHDISKCTVTTAKH